MADPHGNISPEAAAAVARVGKRHRVVQQGRIVLGPERLIACTVRDLSLRGAKIRVDSRHVLPTSFSLVIAAHDLRTLSARLCWRRGDLAGVAFDEAAAP